MSLSIDNLFNDKEAAVKIPDLDWAVIDIEKKDNLPRPFNIQIVPELQEAWNYKDKSASLIPNNADISTLKSDKISSEDIAGVVNTAKKEMMAGLTGKALAQKLASIYPQRLIVAAKDDLKKISEEQGLLGNVYVDITPYDSCRDAARNLGSKVRLAKFVVGEPKRSVCSSHTNGYCKELKKTVIASVEYDESILKEYSDHLKIAGILPQTASLDSKEDLRRSLLSSRERKEESVPVNKESAQQDNYEEIRVAFEKELINKSAYENRLAQERRFHEARPVLAFIQNEMLKGKMGDSLKEAIKSNISSDLITNFYPEIKKIASLQGLIGNVYVDVSYYNTTEDAIKAIKTASTNPTYIVQTIKNGEFDSTLSKIAKATGCSELPRDGKIDYKIASSYIDDLLFTDRLSSEEASSFKNRLEANDNVLGVIREAFLATIKHKKSTREGGIKGYFHQSENKKYANRDSLKGVTYKALEAGISLEKIESKLASVIPTPEAVGMVREALSHIAVVDANSIVNCTSEKYQFSPEAKIKTASKCSSCIMKTCNTCIPTGLRFAADKEPSDSMIKLDSATKKVVLAENPDVARNDMKGDYDLSTASWGSGSNIALDKMRKEANVDIDFNYNSDGLDTEISK